tara:strand:+ start:1095 stop:1913 length:819 start_codon:yes stop_codon:yes gene_type:complete
MPKKWTSEEEKRYRKQLIELYVKRNLSISEIAPIVCLSEKTVFQRLKRLDIPTVPEQKVKYRNKRNDITIPKKYSAELAELLGILFGDGHINRYQVTVTLGDKEVTYASYVQRLIHTVFGGTPKVVTKKNGYRVVYLGSTQAVQYLQSLGLTNNKVRDQVDIPKWLTSNKKYQQQFLRGFFDTDGSVYKLKYGIQLSFTNHSLPLLHSLQEMLLRLEYSPSSVSNVTFYITKRKDIQKFFTEIQPRNQKHRKRYDTIVAQRVGTQAVNGGRL